MLAAFQKDLKSMKTRVDNFMHGRDHIDEFSWPAGRDECNVPYNHVLCSDPVLTQVARLTCLNERQLTKFCDVANDIKTEICDPSQVVFKFIL